MKYSHIIAIATAAAMLGACTEPDGSPARGVMHGGMPNKEEIGTAVGLIGGGIIGSTIGGGTGQVVATIGGAAIGGLLGNYVGSSLDAKDRAAHDRAAQRALESGRTRSWKDSRSGNYGSIAPASGYTNDAGNLCREYNQTIYIGGHKHYGRGTACRNPDGTWEIVG